MKQVFSTALFCILGLSLMTGCSSKEYKLPDTALVENELYTNIVENIDMARFELAAKYFEELETRYPFSPKSLQARLDLAYAYVLYGRPEQAVSEADKFIRFNPTHHHVDYAYYIRGVANFGQRKQLMGGWFPRRPADMDLSALRDAYGDFALLLRNYPDSPYAADAKQRMIYLRNTFAEHEIHVAEFYLDKKAWVAAANRANNVLTRFADTPLTKEALAILLQAYQQLGLNEAASDTTKVLRLNYPDHPLLLATQPLNVAAQ
jgi:outer membrane protein assembly factor BamD